VNTSHILNIGYPKCGTTWCWDLLTQQTWFTAADEKENNNLIKGTAVSDYIKSYINYEITANFSPANFALDRYIIQQLSELPTITVSIILRNPFDIYWSLYNFLPQPVDLTYNDFTGNIVNQSWFHRPAHIINRWQQFFKKDRFCVFFYDDIQKNSSDFFNNYCKQMQLPSPTILDTSATNITQYKYKFAELDATLVSLINQEIENLQSYVDYDVLKWKHQ
jgi:hypothetical protein